MKHKRYDLILDFDETLFGTSRQMKLFLNQYFGIQIPVDCTDYMCGHSLHQFVMQYLPSGHDLCEEDLCQILGSKFLTSTFWHQDVCPLPGVLETIPILAERYNLHIATARQSSSRPVVSMLIDKFLPEHISNTHFVWEHLGDRQFKGIPKRDFVQTLQNPIAYIDDNPKETREIIGMVKHVILFDPNGYHGNQDVSDHHVSHWEEIRHLLL